MPEPITVRDEVVEGELSLDIKPGTTANERDKQLDALLAAPLADAAEQLDSVLAAPAHRFAKPLPGKDDEGLTRFTVRGRAEGGRLVPDHRAIEYAFKKDRKKRAR
jgi:hypothetical protein